MKVAITIDQEMHEYELDDRSARRLCEIAENMESKKTIDIYNRNRTAASSNQQEGYKGFIIAKCDRCGKIKGFCAKTPATEFRCSCGAETPLYHMRKAFLNCKCGRKFKYRTNIIDNAFTYYCLECGSPVDLIWNDHKGVYETLT